MARKYKCIPHLVVFHLKYNMYIAIYLYIYTHTAYSTKFQRTKLLRLDHHVSKTFEFASKQRPLVPKHFGKTFAVQGKTPKSIKVLSLKGFVLYSIASYIA